MTDVPVYVGVGSNIEREINIREGIEALRREFGTLAVSRVYESEAVGFTAGNFYNLAAGFRTELAPQALAERLRAIEWRFGRERESESTHLASRTLDIDLLLYGDWVIREPGLEVPRPDIVKYAFVLLPLEEIAGDVRHPVLGVTIGELRHSRAFPEQRLWPVDDVLAPGGSGD